MTRNEKLNVSKSTININLDSTRKASDTEFAGSHHLLTKIPVEYEVSKHTYQRKSNAIHPPKKEFTAKIVTQPPVRRFTVLEQRSLGNDLSALLPLIKQNCPISLQIDNYQAGKKSTTEGIEKSSALLPPSCPFLSNNHLRHRIRKLRFASSSALPIASSTQLVPRCRKSISQKSPSQRRDLKTSSSTEEITLSEETVTPKKLCLDGHGKSPTSSFHLLTHEKNQNLFGLKQNLTFRDLSPIISCGGRTGYSIPARLTTPTIINLSVEASPCKKFQSAENHSCLPDWSIVSRMGVATAPCATSHQVSLSNSSTDSGLSVGTRGSHSSVASDSGAPSCKVKSSMTSTSDQTNRNERAPSKALVSEHHSFVNLPSSFNIPIAHLGYMTVPSKKGLHSSKSFHGDESNLIHVPHGSTSNQHGNLATGSTVNLRQQQHHRKMLERQRIKMLKPLSVAKNGNVSKSDFSSSVLPDPTTSSYRLTSDVSFDEGSRYNNGAGFNPTFAVETRKDAAHRSKHGTSQPEATSSPYAGAARLEKLADSPNRDRHNHVTPGPYKEMMPMSLVRIEERLNFDSALGRHPSFAMPPGSRGHSAQGGTPTSANAANPNPGVPPTHTTFRLHKGRQSWNYKMGDLSVNGGSYYGSSPLQPGGRIDSAGIGSLSISPASNFSSKAGSQPRERNGTLIKSRMSSRYGCRMDTMGAAFNSSSTRECQYADPCQCAPASFQQRLMELSVLESDTIKYERSRKLKRKKNQDS